MVQDIGIEYWFLGWSLCFNILFGVSAVIKAPNDLLSIGKYVGVALALATLAASIMTVATWGIAELVSGD